MTDIILPQPKDAIHKAWLYRVLSSIYDDASLADVLVFKGGTCAAMLGYLNRFSVDLDFDYTGDDAYLSAIRRKLEKAFFDLGLSIKDQSKIVPQYFLRYDATAGERNTIKIDITFPPPKSNTYELKRFHEIDRIIKCQTIETMMANKLVAFMDRYYKHKAIAGRDLYDIHYFFIKGYRYNADVISERTGLDLPIFFEQLITFIQEYVTDKIIKEDLNALLSHDVFSLVRKVLKRETMMFLQDELHRINKKT